MNNIKKAKVTTKKTYLHTMAENIAKQVDFKIEQLVYQGGYYSPDKIRNVIYSGDFKGKSAVLKVYDDPRLTDEPISLKIFNSLNSNKILIAPELYSYKVLNSKMGWLIMEKLPEGGGFFDSPISFDERQVFLELYLDYRKLFPYEPTRKLTLVENLTADEFHCFRLNRWLQLANDKEFELSSTNENVLSVNDFVPRYKSGIEFIRKEFVKRKMIWCHGHFKPGEIYKVSDTKYYLTDFAHTKMYPEGYEFGFIVWADCIMAADWHQDYTTWRQGIFSWIDDFEPIARKLGIKDYLTIAKASLIERSLGTILADICATNQAREDKKLRINLLYQLLDELM